MLTAPVPRSLGSQPSTARQVLLLPFRALSEVIAALNTSGTRFVLLVANDFTHSDLPLAEFADRVVRTGCAYFCAWGPGCELVHDLVDEAMAEILDDLDDESVLMTTWHNGEPLGDAVFFAVVCASPVGRFAQGCDKIILAIADKESWLREAEQAAREHLSPHAI